MSTLESERLGNWTIASYRQPDRMLRVTIGARQRRVRSGMTWIATAQRCEGSVRRLLNAEGRSRQEAIEGVKNQIPTEATA